MLAAPVWPRICSARSRRAAGPLIVGSGTDLAVYKGTGLPAACPDVRPGQRRGLAGPRAHQGSTQSAVTPEGCHPFSVGPDQCLVHNGSFSNHATIRRHLRAAGVEFDSENDSEVGARFVARRLEEGVDLAEALRALCETFDGFYRCS